MSASGQLTALPALERLRRSRDFEAVMRHGKRARGSAIHLAARPNELPYSRVGYAVSRRVGTAVTRNRVKRRLREIVRELPILPGFDIVALPQPSSRSTSFRDLERDTERCAEKLNLLAPLASDSQRQHDENARQPS